MKWRIPLSRPVIGAAEEQAVLRVLRSERLANGPLADTFARKVAAFHGLANGVAVSSGTLGLELALRALGVGPGDRVACPAYTFVASANAILAVGAEPVFVDVGSTGTMTVRGAMELAKAKAVKAAVVVDLFGEVAASVGKAFKLEGIPVVEDACEAFGSEGFGYGDLVVFGFYPNKQITTGEGGVVCGGAEATLRDKVFRMRNHGTWPYPNEQSLRSWGTNARMSEIHAALGLAQLRRAKSMLRARARVAGWYHDSLPESICPLPMDGRSWFVFPVWFRSQDERDAVREAMAKARIQTGDYFPYIPAMPQYGLLWPEYPMARKLSETGLALPFFPQMAKEEVREVVRVLRKAVR